MDNFKMPEVPGPKQNDPEDVSWALSTAVTMWSRGDHAEAIKWIRRGAEAASEAEADDRALELAKAAADLASMIVRLSQADTHAESSPVPQIQMPPPASVVPPSMPPPASVPPIPQTARSVPPPAGPQPPRPSAMPAPMAQPVHPSMTKTLTSQMSPVAASVAQPRVGTAADKGPRPLQAARGPERVQSTSKGVLSPRAEPTKRRKSSANLDQEARAAQALDNTRPLEGKVDRAVRDEIRKTTIDAPSIEDAAPHTQDDLGRTVEGDTSEQIAATKAAARGSKGRRKSRTNEARTGAVAPPDTRPRLNTQTEEWDGQTTQALSRAELDSITNEHAMPRMERPPIGADDTSDHDRQPSSSDEPAVPIIASQAVRVILWRDAEGVHVAPHGTMVSAITVDAMLVALDPSADLSAWLDRRGPRPK